MSLPTEAEMRARIEELFKVQDTDDSGYLVGPEVHKICEKMSKEVTGQDDFT